MQDLSSKRVIAVGVYTDGLYKLSRDSFCPKVLQQANGVMFPGEETSRCLTSAADLSKKPNIWHLKLGHASDKVLQHVSNIHFENAKYNCCVCPKAKQHRISFQHSRIKTTHKLQMIHCDVWRPYEVQSKIGA